MESEWESPKGPGAGGVPQMAENPEDLPGAQGSSELW